MAQNWPSGYFPVFVRRRNGAVLTGIVSEMGFNFVVKDTNAAVSVRVG